MPVLIAATDERLHLMQDDLLRLQHEGESRQLISTLVRTPQTLYRSSLKVAIINIVEFISSMETPFNRDRQLTCQATLFFMRYLATLAAIQLVTLHEPRSPLNGLDFESDLSPVERGDVVGANFSHLQGGLCCS